MAHLRWAAMAFACLLAGPAAARPYTVSDLLNLESLGQVLIDPSARWLAVQVRGPWSQSSRFDLDLQSHETVSRLQIFAVEAQPKLHLSLGPQGGQGLVPGPFSPDGARMVVYRVGKAGRELGVLTLADGRLSWTGRWLHGAAVGRKVQWRTPSELVALVAREGAPAPGADHFWRAQARLPALWAASARGDLGVSVLGSGAFESAKSPQAVQAIGLNAVSGKVQLLAEAAFDDLELSPSGRFLALIDQSNSLPSQALGPDALDTAAPLSRRRLRLIDLGDGHVHWPCPNCDLQGQVLTWAPQVDHLLFSARPLAWDDRQSSVSEPPVTVAPAGKRGALEARPAKPASVQHPLDPAPLVSSAAPDKSLERTPAGSAIGLWVWRNDRAAEPAGALPITMASGGQGAGLALVQAAWLGQKVLAWGLSADIKPDQTTTPPSGPAAQGLALGGGDRPTAQSSESRSGWWLLSPKDFLAPPQFLGLSDAQLVASGKDGALLAQGNGLLAMDLGGGSRPAAGSGQVLDTGGRQGQGWRLALTPSNDPQAIGWRLARSGEILAPATRELMTGHARPGERLVAANLDLGGMALVAKSAEGVSKLIWQDRAGQRWALASFNQALAQIKPAKIYEITKRDQKAGGVGGLYFEPSQAPKRDDAGRPKPWPLVVVPYPGASYRKDDPAFAPDALSFMANVQILAGAGYGVLVPNMPIQEEREPYEGLADQLLEIVDLAAQDHAIDSTKIALWGQSYGGWAALMAAAQSKRFSAVIASAPMTNLTSFYGQLPPQFATADEIAPPIAAIVGWSEAGQGRMLVPPWVDPQRYLRNSPALQADKITAPVLLLYGDMDLDVSQTQSMFVNLARQGRDVMMATYRGEGHLIVGPGNVRDLYQRVLGFLDRALAAPGSKESDNPD